LAIRSSPISRSDRPKRRSRGVRRDNFFRDIDLRNLSSINPQHTSA